MSRPVIGRAYGVSSCVTEPQLILAIETSNPSSGPHGLLDDGAPAGPGVALGSNEEQSSLIGQELLRESARQDDDLMPAIERLFRRHDAQPRQIARVAVSVGPGGYTGVRIAVAAAKLIAEASGGRTVAVPSARSAAWRIGQDMAPAAVCLASKRGAAHATVLPTHAWWDARGRDAVLALVGEAGVEETERRIGEGRQWIAASCEVGVISAEQLARLGPETLIADRHLPETFVRWADANRVRIVEPIFSAQSVLEIAGGERGCDPGNLRPIYPREPDAVTQWRARKQSDIRTLGGQSV